MNKTQLIGRTTKDIELKKTQSGKSVATFNLAVNRRGKDEGADFIQCVAWGKTAENLSQYVKKGNRIGLCGRIQTRTYESNGYTRYVTEVIADEIEFLENKPSAEPQYEPNNDDSYWNDDSIDEEINASDLPF